MLETLGSEGYSMVSAIGQSGLETGSSTFGWPVSFTWNSDTSHGPSEKKRCEESH